MREFPDDAEILTAEEAAGYLGLSMRDIHTLCRARLIPFWQVSPRIRRFHRKQLREWAQRVRNR
jgi:excisionase family DNA binding protein